MNYSEAMKAAQEGAAVSCWGGLEFVYWVPPASYPAQTAIAKAYFGENALVPYAGYMTFVGGGPNCMYVPTEEEQDDQMQWDIVEVRLGSIVRKHEMDEEMRSKLT